MLTKKLFKVAFILILIGGIGMLFTYKSYFKSISIAEDLEIESKGYENIDIDINISDLEIIEIEDGEEPRVEIRGASNIKNQPTYKARVENGTLYVEEKKSGIKLGNVGSIHRQLNIKVYTKKKDYNKINVSSNVGDIKINNISSSALYVESQVGSITLDNVNCDLDLNSSVGDIKISFDKIQNDIKASCSGVGSIKLITKDEVDATFKASSGIGDINILDKYKGYAELGSGKYTIELETEIGDIDVKQK